MLGSRPTRSGPLRVTLMAAIALLGAWSCGGDDGGGGGDAGEGGVVGSSGGAGPSGGGAEGGASGGGHGVSGGEAGRGGASAEGGAGAAGGEPGGSGGEEEPASGGAPGGDAGSGGTGPTGGESSAGAPTGEGPTAEELSDQADAVIASIDVCSAETLAITISGADPTPVSDTFFGQNYWAWVVDWGDPVAAVRDPTAELELNLLRAGGTNNESQDPSPFTLEEVDGFIDFAEAVGAEPLLQVPMVRNPAGGAATAEDAADLVRYVEGRVRHFTIGNEPDLYVQNGVREEGFDATAHCETFRSFAEAMREVDPDIVIAGPESAGPDWLVPFLPECGDVVDVVSLHRYPFGPEASTREAAYADIDGYRSWLEQVRGWMNDAGLGDTPLFITEANITYDGEPEKSIETASPGTFPAALWLADNVGASLEAGLGSLSYWSLSEGWTLGFFDGVTPRPAYHVYRAFTTGFGDQALTVAGTRSDLSVFSGRDDAGGSTTVFVVNKSEEPLIIRLSFEELPLSQEVALVAPAQSLLVAKLADDGGGPHVSLYEQSMDGVGEVTDGLDVLPALIAAGE